MSDLQDLIAKNAVIAYNQGFERGEASERERIIKLAADRICFDHKDGCEHGVCYGLSDMIALIKGEQK